MKNKKGFMLLAEETLKTIIAIIAISFLVYILASLYFADVQEKNKLEAEQSLETIELIIDSANSTGNATAIAPSGWHLMSFTEEYKPNSCINQNCICICDKVNLYDQRQKAQAKKCDKKGACLVVPNVVKFSPIKIERIKKGLTDISIRKIEEFIKITKL